MTDKQLTAAAVRQSFLTFFEERQHRIVPSGPVFPQDDPTLLFTNAGMNQFKDVFLGTGARQYSRAADSQKCIRVQGKHNDLEEVGVDTYHHTFFEMLGNWSFGDYFKEEAISWAWELLTDTWSLPKERLWVTVFAGDERDGLPADEETERLWLERTDIDPSHVLRFDKTDNFWEMGETGPCGPCTEIHIDRGGDGGAPTDGGDPGIGVNAGNERFIELWNLVFIQFNRQDDGALVELPAKHVDTGMGFERILSVLQGKSSNYDTDLFGPIFEALSTATGKPYGEDPEIDIAFRVCADHIRAVTSAIADGAEPSNEGRGYVLRRLIRRASRYGLQALEMEEPFLHGVVPATAEILGVAYPEISSQLEHVCLVVEAEEKAFRRTLRKGLSRFEKVTRGLPSGATIPGQEAFELYATDGFPLDLVELMARERGLVVDQSAWEQAATAHSAASRGEGSFKQLLSGEQLAGIPATRSTYHEAGEKALDVQATVLRMFAEAGRPDRLILDSSPFYPEGGGQVGDIGTIEGEGFSFQVQDTRKDGDVVIHIGHSAGMSDPGAAVRCTVDSQARAATRRNHTATHLMHRALRIVLGEHVTQKGSYVGPDRLRFDFSNPKGLHADQLAEVERLVSDCILGNSPLVTTVEKPAAAKARGVMALFGEKYGDLVRVVDIGGWSTELCGGTHVERSGDIGPFLILSEQSISAGVRRIEAVTGKAALDHIQTQRALLEQAAASLKVRPADIHERVSALQQQVKEAKKKQKQATSSDLAEELATIKQALITSGGIQHAVLHRPAIGAGDLKDLADRLKSLGADLAIAIFGSEGDKVPFLIVSTGQAQASGLRAGDLARALKQHLGGGGGGRPDVAQGQGARPEGVEAAMEATVAAIREATG